MTEIEESVDPYAALRHQDFRLLLSGRFLTSFGEEMLSFAVGWELWLRTHSAFALGMVGLVQVIPVVLLSLPAGHIADQYERKRIVVLAEVLLAVCAFGLGWLSWELAFRVLSMSRLLRRWSLKLFPPRIIPTRPCGIPAPGRSLPYLDPQLLACVQAFSSL